MPSGQKQLNHHLNAESHINQVIAYQNYASEENGSKNFVLIKENMFQSKCYLYYFLGNFWVLDD